MDNIIVHVRGGVVQDVEMPDGATTVEVRDYDDGKAARDNGETEHYKTDQDGIVYTEVLHESKPKSNHNG